MTEWVVMDQPGATFYSTEFLLPRQDGLVSTCSDGAGQFLHSACSQEPLADVAGVMDQVPASFALGGLRLLSMMGNDDMGAGFLTGGKSTRCSVTGVALT